MDYHHERCQCEYIVTSYTECGKIKLVVQTVNYSRNSAWKFGRNIQNHWNNNAFYSPGSSILPHAVRSAIVSIAVCPYHVQVIWRWIIVTLKRSWKSCKLVPFGRLGAVSYSPSIVTMSVSLTVYEIFSVNEWRDFESGGSGGSMLLKMAPFDRLHTTIYWSAIVNIFLSCTVLSYFTLNNIVTLKCGLEVIQGHSNWYHSKAWGQFPIRLP